MSKIHSLALILIIGFGCSKKVSMKKEDPTIIPSKGNKVTGPNFTGNVYVQMFAQQDTVYNVSIGNVTFEPGARTCWHSHPGGQILMITEGTGYYQEKGSPKRWMHKGDIIKCPYNIEHWHGASPETGVTHLAISTNTQLGGVIWSRAVTDEEYGILPGK